MRTIVATMIGFRDLGSALVHFDNGGEVEIRRTARLKMDLGSSTELITLKPWCTGKQLPLGFSVLGQATSDLALAGDRGKPTEPQAPSHKLDKLQAIGY